jgi:hypothetical protein
VACKGPAAPTTARQRSSGGGGSGGSGGSGAHHSAAAHVGAHVPETSAAVGRRGQERIALGVLGQGQHRSAVADEQAQVGVIMQAVVAHVVLVAAAPRRRGREQAQRRVGESHPAHAVRLGVHCLQQCPTYRVV